MVQLGLLVRPDMREILRPAKKNAGSQDIAEPGLEVWAQLRHWPDLRPLYRQGANFLRA
jgi:hypothetical protein